MTRLAGAVAALAFALGAPGDSHAGLITWELSGTIESASPWTLPGGFGELHADEVIPDLVAAGLSPGAPWSARVTFDSDVTPAPCEDCVGFAEFLGATLALEFAAGSFAAASAAGVTGNAYSLAYGDPLVGGSDLYFTAAVGGGTAELVAESAALVFVSADPAALFATSLPGAPPDLLALVGPTLNASGSYWGTRLQILGHGFVRNSDVAIFYGGPPLVPQSFAIDARITSIAPVPEPAVLALVIAATAATAIRRRSRALL